MNKNKEILKLDLYSILDIPPNASKEQIRKAFRKNAIKCHPDKNLNNPDAAEKFVQLKKILEILLDSDSKKHYDKLLRGRKEAEIRARNLSAETERFKRDLERREKEARDAKYREEVEKERCIERKRWIAENDYRIIEEEHEWAVNEQWSRDRKEEHALKGDSFRCIKAKWKKTEEWEGFTKEEIERIFYKFGDMDACVMTEKGTKAIIEFREKLAADMAVLYEKGLPGKEIKVSYFGKQKESKKRKLSKSSDTESIYQMNQRRGPERQKIMEEMRARENLDS